MTRRSLLDKSKLVAGALALQPLVDSARGQAPEKKLKVVVVGAHVDDPQSGCGGTMALFANRGHTVVALSLTHGDSISIAKRVGMSDAELAQKRSTEAVRACEILKSHIKFLDQVNGDTQINVGWYDRFRKVLLDEKPDAVFTHWPIDKHRDHRAASLLTYDA